MSGWVGLNASCLHGGVRYPVCSEAVAVKVVGERKVKEFLLIFLTVVETVDNSVKTAQALGTTTV
jgi:hypothetical protein